MVAFLSSIEGERVKNIFIMFYHNFIILSFLIELAIYNGQENKSNYQKNQHNNGDTCTCFELLKCTFLKWQESID